VISKKPRSLDGVDDTVIDLMRGAFKIKD